jgi:phosphatidylglycerophosphate synthase
MLSRWVRRWDSGLLKPLMLWLARRGATPNLLTLVSLLIIALAGLILAAGNLVLGGVVFLLGGVLDGIDGELARATQRESRLGAFLDSIGDHCGDFALYAGLLWFALAREKTLLVFLIFLALFGSMLGSQIRSRAGMLGIQTKDVGAATRFERTLILIGGLFSGQLEIAGVLLALINNGSAAERLVYVVRAFERSP